MTTPFTQIDPPHPVSGNVFVYMLACPDGALYVGSAGDVFRRTKLHQTGRGAKFTRDHVQPVLVYWEGPFDPVAAIHRERQLKRWSRAKKLALIGGNLAKLHSLARRRVSPPANAGSGIGRAERRRRSSAATVRENRRGWTRLDRAGSGPKEHPA